MKSRAVCLSLALLLLLPSPAFGAWPGQAWLTRCARLLQGTDWKDAYRKAHETGEVRNGAIALARLLSLHGESWNLHPKSQAHFARAAEVLALKAVRMESSGSPDYSYRLRDLRSPADHLRDTSKFWLKELAWASSPFFFRWAHLRDADAKFIAFFSSPQDFLAQHGKQIANLGILADPFFERVVNLLFPAQPSVWGKRLAVSEFGTLLRPIILSLALFANQAHPVQLVIQQSEPDYALGQYFDDIEKMAGVEWKGKTVSILVDRSFFGNGPSKRSSEPKGLETDPLLGIAELQKIRQAAGHLHEALVGSHEELGAELQKASESDIVLLIAHGRPGDFILGTPPKSLSQTSMNQIPEGPFKKPAPILVFISCDFGDKALGRPAGEKEPWKQFSEKLLSNTEGRSFASINTLLYHRTLQKDVDVNALPDPSTWAIYLKATCAQGTGFCWLQAALCASNRLTNHYGATRGVREYRPSTGVTVLYESEE